MNQTNDTHEFACLVGGKLEFNLALKRFKHEYTGKMFGHKNSRLNYLVSEGHQVYSKKYYTKNAEYQLTNISEAYGKKLKHIMTADPYVSRKNIKNFDLPDTDVSISIGDWAEFIGWFLSEGCVSHYKDGHTAVSISQVKEVNPEKWENLSRLLLSLPFDFKHYERYFFDHRTRELHRYLETLGTYANNKQIPDYYFELPVSARMRLLKGLLAGDGRRKDPRNYEKHMIPFDQDTYTTSSEKLAKDVERLMIGLGFATSFNKYADSRQESYHDVYEIRMLDFTELLANPDNYYTAESDGHVYSVTVPGNKVLIRREGSWAH